MEILQEGHELLKTKTKAVSMPLSKKDKETLDEMMKYVEDGYSIDDENIDIPTIVPIGLSAPQIGISKSMFVMMGNTTSAIAVINPIIFKKSSEKEKKVETCLSVEGEYEISRRTTIMISAYIYDGVDIKRKKLQLTGIGAKIFQHEYDHLHGILISDYKGGV